MKYIGNISEIANHRAKRGEIGTYATSITYMVALTAWRASSCGGYSEQLSQNALNSKTPDCKPRQIKVWNFLATCSIYGAVFWVSQCTRYHGTPVQIYKCYLLPASNAKVLGPLVFLFSLTWDPTGVKMSKCYSPYKSQPKSSKNVWNFEFFLIIMSDLL